jgi:hypothetical protein
MINLPTRFILNRDCFNDTFVAKTITFKELNAINLNYPENSECASQKRLMKYDANAAVEFRFRGSVSILPIHRI